MKILFKTVFLLFIFFSISCKKNKKDTPPPVITFNAPASGQVFGYSLDPTLKTYTISINVNAHVSDNEQISSISVMLTDMNHVPQQNSMNVQVSSNNFTFNVNYEVTQFHLTTGSYYMQITVSDANNTTVSNQLVNIIASPTLLWGYCPVLRNTSTIISCYDTSAHTLFSLPTLGLAYNGMKYGGYNAQLYVNGSGNGTQQLFHAYTMQPQSYMSAYSISSPSNETYTCLYSDGTKPYVGYYNTTNAIVYSYQNGSQSTSYRFPTNTPYGYPYYFTTTSLYGVAAYKSKVTGVVDYITTFTLSSGASLNSTPFPANFKALAIFEKGQDSLYVLGNDTIANQAQIYIYQPSINGFSSYQLISDSVGKMLSAVKVNNEYIVFSTSSGVYPCNGLSVNAALLSTGAQKLCYQPGLNMLAVANSASAGGTINAYSVGSNTLSLLPYRSITFNDSIIDFEVITNK